MLAQRIQNVFPRDSLVFCDLPEDCIESADSKRGMIGNRNSLMTGRLSLENDMAAHLIHDAVVPMLAERPHQFAPR